ncbi:tetratricopeptide repeat protein [Mangrovicoccus sp. HB161399]|uniref:tetratricopeptide repeat protein n=1 Tax=Mangrovicoccus sp. HB161399 TaxID=2720392 RepID=UPI001556C9CA|nr:tetratricopeptide repeat protein [Mangrovicoccus sp. HB161399]
MKTFRALLVPLLLSAALPCLAQAQTMPPPGSVSAEAKAAADAGDLPRAIVLYGQAAVAGERGAAAQVARLALEGGDGAAPDYALARLWAGRAVEAGDSRGYLYLGQMAMEGLGAAADAGLARDYFLKGYEAGDLKAPRYLGLLDAASGDAAGAAEWYRKGADAGDITSQHYLGRAYQLGAGVPQDFAEAMAWYAKAAGRGDLIASDGIAGMASLYEAGQGVPADPAKALALYRRAAELGNERAAAALARLGG